MRVFGDCRGFLRQLRAERRDKRRKEFEAVVKRLRLESPEVNPVRFISQMKGISIWTVYEILSGRR